MKTFQILFIYCVVSLFVVVTVFDVCGAVWLINSQNATIKQLTAERDTARTEASTRFSSCYEMAKDPVIKQQFLESK